jgi:putative ABC transport system permease protein
MSFILQIFGSTLVLFTLLLLASLFGLFSRVPLRYSTRSLVVRKTTTVATALGIALVVFVLATALMLSAGIKRTLAVSGHPDVAVVLRKGSDAELGSVIETNAIGTILGNGVGIKRDAKGNPIGIAEVVVVGAMEKIGASGVTNVQIRGVPEGVQEFRPEVAIVAGRAPTPGAGEAMIGQRIRGRFKNVDLGASFDLRKNRPLKIVGVFSSGGSAYESEIWGDIDAVRSAYGRDGVVSSVRVKLDSPSAYDAFKANMESDKQFGFSTLRETEYFEKQSEGTSLFITILGTIISVLFSIGAMIGAMITMFGAVAHRQREIGTLRALGFSRRGILLSFMAEALLLALIGGAVGVLASFGMGFVKFSMMNFSSWSEIVFSFEPTPAIILTSLVFGGGMGLIGGFFPALRAAFTSPVTAMRGG